ncbi:MAG: outer membrane beta-barrel protein [Bacteroidia bacterium]
MSGLKSHNEFDSLETFFNSRLKDASLEPTDNSWMLIEEELNRLAKEKRRRRFLWFFSLGLLLVCGVASLWYYSVDSKQLTVNNEQGTVVSQKSEVVGHESRVISQESKVGSEKLEAVSSKQPETVGSQKSAIRSQEIVETENKNSENVSNQKIQLGAFKHTANVAVFNKIPYKVIEVNSEDGYKKYYAVSDEKDALEKVQQAGFAEAFVKENFNPANQSHLVKGEGIIETSTPVYVAAKTASPAKTDIAFNETKQNVKANTPAVTSANDGKVTNPVSKKEQVFAPVVPKTNDTNPEDIIAINENVQAPGTENKFPEVKDTKGEVALTENKPVALKVDSGKKVLTPAATNETKKDSTHVKEEKKDSVPTPVKTAAADSGKKSIFTPVWSIALLGGPNFFSSNSQSTTAKTLNEHQQLTYNGELKVQYRPIKFLSVSGGVNFTTFTAKQDATYFRFNKYQTSDYLFHSSFGDMAVPMSDMLQGFWFNAPTDSFFANYSYTTTLQTINIPVEANLHFLNTKWVNLSLGIGANSSYAIGQQTHFSLIKENSTQGYTYNNVTANKFNLLLMASLGCDVRITKHWYITLNPSYKYGVTNMSPVSGTTYKPAFFSANGGVKFKF